MNQKYGNNGFPATKEMLMYSIVKLDKPYIYISLSQEKIAFLVENSMNVFYNAIPASECQNLKTSIQKVTQESINNWFEEVRIYLKNKRKLDDALCSP